MGMFDTVMVQCPRCGEEHEFQSKGGGCFLQVFNLTNCPDDVLADVNRHSPYRCDCGAIFEVDIINRIPILCQMSEKKQTSVEWFYDKIKSHFEHDGDLLETLIFTMSIAKEKERDQHGNTWDAAIKAHDDRGHVFARSICDFDDYEVS